jgi:hypothetical protein
MKKKQKDLTTLLHVFLLDLNHACLSVSTIDRDISHDFPPDVPNTQAAAPVTVTPRDPDIVSKSNSSASDFLTSP